MTLPLLCLPLDDRPVTCDMPHLLARVAGETLLLPPRQALGRFLQPGDPDALIDWLQRAAPTARAAIVSLDMLAYGGLVASRTPDVAADEALRRLEKLRALKARSPHLRLYAFSVIMRLTITSRDQETRAHGQDIFRYSVLRDQAERLGDTAAAAELQDVEARLPRPLLEAYLAARARNHAVNRAALRLLEEGVLDYLALVQEDTAPVGVHVVEQQRLIAQARATVPDARWRLYPGTDESAVTLLARCLHDEYTLAQPMEVAFRDRSAADYPARFEDLPLWQATDHHINAIGGDWIAARHPMHLLGVHTFKHPQPDFVEMPPLPTPTWEAALAHYPHLAEPAWLADASPATLAIADVAYCNGGDPQLLDLLLARGQYPALAGYAGWNTAGNTLGTALAHAALRRFATFRGVTPAMEAAHHEALLVRILDDGLYQPIVRGWVTARAEEYGASALNLGEAASRVATEVDAVMHTLWTEVRARHASAQALDRPFRATLPWGRLFEVGITLMPREGRL